MSQANKLTSDLLIEVPKRFPSVRLWRSNTGGAVGVTHVRQAIGQIRSGDYLGAIRTLSRIIKFGVEGQADISGIIGPQGRRLEIEVKVGDDKLSQGQINFRSMIQSRGGLYIVASDMEHVFSAIADAISFESL